MAQTTWAHRATHPLVCRLIGTSVTPNHLTALRVVTGLVAVWLLAVGHSAGGGSLFVVSAFLDRADGELARMSGQTSRLGHYLDFGSDIAITVLLFVGIGIGLREHPWIGSWALPLGAAAGLAVALIFLLAMRLEALGPSAFKGAGGFDPDDLLFLVAPIAWLDGLAWLLLAAGIGAPLFLLVALLRWGPALPGQRSRRTL
jgi:phosphatidylglycerophosphate synthase